MIHPLARLLAPCLLALSAAAGGSVLVVDDDGGPGVDFTTIQAAVDAAADGAVLLVRDGTYAGFQVQAKSLQILADAGAAPEVGSMSIRDLAPNQEVLLRGLTSDNLLPNGALALNHNQGFVWVEDCTLGFPATLTIFGPPPFGGAGVHAVDSAGLALLRCTVFGGYNPTVSPIAGEPALRVILSSVWLYDCELTGAAGFFTNVSLPEADPGPGAFLDEGFLWASGSRIEGGKGKGGDSAFGSCFPAAGPGGIVSAPGCASTRRRRGRMPALYAVGPPPRPPPSPRTSLGASWVSSWVSSFPSPSPSPFSAIELKLSLN